MFNKTSLNLLCRNMNTERKKKEETLTVFQREIMRSILRDMQVNGVRKRRTNTEL